MNGVKTLSELKALRKQFKEQKKKVVFTNGCFDLIHAGHVDYLTKAKALGDILIVGMNTDNSVGRIKGNKRPILNQDERAFVISSLKPVDYVTFFDDDTPKEIINEIIPDILVKGADWAIDKIVGRDVVEKNGGVVRTIEFVNTRSTSQIIDSIIKKYSELPEFIIGDNFQIQSLITIVNELIRSDSNILIEGEPFLNKELLAEYIHKHSSRADRPFVVMNCASISDQLMESELFGQEKDYFADVKKSKEGLVEIADGGTLVLIQIEELSNYLLSKLINFVESGEYRRMGGTESHKSSMRIIGVTERNIIEEVKDNRVKRDQLSRLNMIRITIPAIGDKQKDLLFLNYFFLEAKATALSPKTFTN